MLRSVQSRMTHARAGHANMEDRQLFAAQWAQIGILARFVISAQICYSCTNLLRFVIPAQICYSQFTPARAKWSNTKVGSWQIKGGIIFTIIETFPSYFRFQLSKRATASEADRQLRMMTLCGLSSGWMMVGQTPLLSPLKSLSHFRFQFQQSRQLAKVR